MEVPTELGIPALGHLLATPVAVGPRRTADEAIVGRVAIEDEGACPRLLRGEDLHGAMAPPVAGNCDAPADVHPEARELFVVGREAVVDVYHRTLRDT
jgi:hypothetical protein